MGIFLFRAGRMEEAERLLSEAVKGRPDFGEAMGELGRVYYQTGRIPEAVQMLGKASGLRPDLEWISLLLERARRRL
jgi:Flp pilus assembly protein TadD